MRHQNKTVKLGRSQSHRDALLANQIVSLIEHSRIKTTLAKAKAVRPLAERMVTLGKKNTLHARRTALSYLMHNEAAVKKLFADVAPRAATRQGGYTRIVKLGFRKSDAAPMALIEWVDSPVVEEEAIPEAKPAKAKKTAPKESPPTTEKKPRAPRKAKGEKAADAETKEAAE
ncbi:MAG: large subunit ribosomal protein [Chthoniobacter sp.]|jgi:large subunit ribosomal protein L17|nr:large subunit ribosomal protein [Chthoniobacter sp.]